MTSKKRIEIVILIILVILLGWFLFRMWSEPSIASPVMNFGVSTTTAQTGQVTTTISVTNAGDNTGANANKGQSVPSAAPTSVPHPTAITSPASNAQWVVATDNSIAWNRAANITGGIYLVNATNGTVVGWILQQTGPHQTSFTWNTRDLLLSRTSPTKFTVAVGTYVIKVMFDSPEDPTITSAPFSIIAPNQVQIPTYSVSIANSIFAPSSLTVKRGSKIVFTDDDSVGYQVLVSSFSPFSISAGNSYTLDTTPLSPGPYSIYSSSYPALRMNLTIQ